MNKVKLSTIINRNKEIIHIDKDRIYEQVTVRMWNKGVTKRGVILGQNILGKRYVVKSGQFIISKIDARHAAFGFIPQELNNAVITADFLSYSLDNNKINPLYFDIFIKTPYFFEECKRASSGTTNRIRLNEDKFLDIEIPLPSLDEQKRIIAKVKIFYDKEKELNEIHEANITYILNLRQTILKEAVQGSLIKKDDEIVERPLQKWKEVEFSDVATFLRGPFGSSVQKSVCVSKGRDTYKLYEQGNVINNNFKRGHYYLTCDKFEELRKFEIAPGDILITCAGTLGKIAVVPKDIERGIINSVLMRIRLNDRIDKNFFIYLFKSSLIQDFIASESPGIAVKNLFATKILKKIRVPLPEIHEQKRIVEKVDKLMAFCNELERQVKENQVNSKQLMEAVLGEHFK